MSDPVWYRSLYWRIAFGFVALLAVLLLAQAALFLWLTGEFVESPRGRTPQQLADFVARELSTELTARPDLDLERYVREEFDDVRRPFVVVMRDGRRVSNRPEALPRGFPGGPGPRPEGPRPEGFGGGRGRRGRGGPNSAPVVVNGVQVGSVSVPPSPPTFVALQEFGPTLAVVGLGLLAAGAAIMALLIFRPTHKRLRTLELAAHALGEGRSDVRANEAGGDEVSSLARAFNRMAADLESRADALAASDRARRQLLADVSHELMTPLTAIRGYVETLAMPGLADDEDTRRRYLRIVDEETHKLEAMIGDLLDLARLEGGGGALSVEVFPIAELFRRVSDRHGPAVRERRIALDVSAPDELTVSGDLPRLEQALQNLAANAVRHTPPGGRVELRADAMPGAVRITVRDTGPGIPPEHLPHVFDRFYKADASRASTRASGSGLGLSIVKAIVERHGGSVRASNAPEGGAEFEIVLPLANGVSGPPPDPSARRR